MASSKSGRCLLALPSDGAHLFAERAGGSEKAADTVLEFVDAVDNRRNLGAGQHARDTVFDRTRGRRFRAEVFIGRDDAIDSRIRAHAFRHSVMPFVLAREEIEKHIARIFVVAITESRIQRLRMSKTNISMLISMSS
jgi:hypothetical protein